MGKRVFSSTRNSNFLSTGMTGLVFLGKNCKSVFFCCAFSISKKNKMASRTDQKKALRNGFDINYALRNVINSDTRKVLESLTDLFLAKAYYYSIQPDQTGCTCCYCTLDYEIRKVLMDRGTNHIYLSGGVGILAKFEETEPFYPFYEE